MEFVLHSGCTMYTNVVVDARVARTAGYDGIELWIPKLRRYLDAGYSASDLREELGPLRVEMLDTIVSVERLDERLLEEAVRMARVAGELDCPLLQVVALDDFDADDWPAQRAVLVDALSALAAAVGEHGVRLALEPVTFSRFRRLDQALEVMEAVGTGAVGLCLDTWHLWTSDAEWSAVAALDPARIACVHLGDTNPKAGPAWRDADRTALPGDGILPLGDAIAAIQATGYDGPWSVEMLSARHWEWDPLDLAVELLARTAQAARMTADRQALSERIAATPWIDTHEHLVEERHRLSDRPYVFTPAGEAVPMCVPADWTALIANYALDDLVSAGLPAADAERLVLGEDAPEAKWAVVAPWYEAARHTGYLRAVDLTVERLFGLRLGADTVAAVDAACRALRQPGYYRHVLQEVAAVESCQVNSLDANPFCVSDAPDLLQQDLSVFPLVLGQAPAAEAASGLEVASLRDYLDVMEWCFATYGAAAVAIKCQWAYVRTLAVGVVDAPPERAFARLRAGEADAGERRMVGDYLFTRAVELAAAHNLPVKLHLGYLAGNREPLLAELGQHVAAVTPVVQRHPQARFVLMHMAWPGQEGLLALAKHAPNVVVDLCWAWIAAPRATTDFVQRFLTTVPANKLFCFGGDYVAVECVVGHAELARRGLTAALAGLVADDWLSREEALRLVPALMRDNALAYFA